MDTVQLDFSFKVSKREPVLKKQSRKAAQKDFVFDLMDCLTSPTIVFSSAWKDAVPAETLSNIKLDRMRCRMAGEEMASMTEVVAYMMPRTFESPLTHEWVNIYLWAGGQYAQTFGGSNKSQAMAEIAPESLSDYEQSLMNDLRRWIYKKRREALKAKMKAEINGQPKPENLQKDLFNKPLSSNGKEKK